VHLFSGVQPEVYALVGMAAVLAAVVHAPLASILILAEVTKNNSLVLPAMFATVVATATARRIISDSVYTRGLRSRGIQLGSGNDMMLLRRLNVEQVDLDPAPVLQANDPFQRVLDLSVALGVTDFVVIDTNGIYLGMIVNDDVNAALLRRDAVPLMLVGELMRASIPTVRSTDDLATVMDVFTIHNVSRLPVCLPQSPGKVIGLISRVALMRRYRRGLAA
jgi:CIC family chloride channel protein